MNRYKCCFSFYGGKSKIAHLYPTPKYPLIIEPFAGGAGYSLLHHTDHQVWLNDLDKVIYSIWKLLTLPEAEECIRKFIPDTVTQGTHVAELLEEIVDHNIACVAPGIAALLMGEAWQGTQGRDDLPGYTALIGLLRAEANQSTQGAKGIHNYVTWMGAKNWHRLKPRLLYWIPLIKDWKVTNLPYQELPDLEATWFIDPPYNNSAGARYRTQVPDYKELADWCLARRGQLIVCENQGADWLPFKPLCERRGIMSRYQKSKSVEAVYVRDD